MHPAKKQNRQLGHHGTAEGHQHPGRLTIATDGACDSTRVGSGYVSSAGHYGLRGHPYPDDLAEQHRVVVTELRAVHHALERLLNEIPRTTPIRVLLDSAEALSLIKEWTKGGDRMPEGYRQWRYSGNTPTLYLLRNVVTHTPTLSFRHQRGHVGHPLNEAADSLAKLALRYSRGMVEMEAVRRLAPQWAHHAATDFAQQAGGKA
ncbi:ribonuclease HI [Streptomyces cellulosae]